MASKSLQHFLLFTLLTVVSGGCVYFQDIAPPERLPVIVPVNAEKARKELSEYKELDEESYQINNVYIVNRPISEKDEFIPEFVNFFHWTTEKHVIRSELLFRRDETVKNEKIHESARNLRSLYALKEVDIYLLPSENDEGHDAVVMTRDQLSSNVRWGASGSGDYRSLHIEGGDSNLFGRLYSVNVAYDAVNFVNSGTIRLAQPRIAGSAWGISLFHSRQFVQEQNNRESSGMVLRKPFRTLSDKHYFKLTLSESEGMNYDFNGGDVAFARDRETGRVVPLITYSRTFRREFEYRHAIGRLERFEFGAGMGEIYRKYDPVPYDQQYQIKPEEVIEVSDSFRNRFLDADDNARFVSGTFSYKNIEYLKRRNYQAYFYTEDLQRGFIITNKARLAHPAFQRPDHYIQNTLLTSYIYDRDDIRNVVSGSRSVRYYFNREQPWRNDMTEAENRFYWFRDYGTWAMRTHFAIGHHLEKSFRFDAGGEYLRGYPLGLDLGSRAWLVSTEYRTPPWRFIYFAIAGVVFFDVGQVSENTDEPYRALASPGIGLRFNLVEFDRNIFRLDYGFPLEGESSGPSLNFGLQHSF